MQATIISFKRLQVHFRQQCMVTYFCARPFCENIFFTSATLMYSLELYLHILASSSVHLTHTRAHTHIIPTGPQGKVQLLHLLSWLLGYENEFTLISWFDYNIQRFTGINKCDVFLNKNRGQWLIFPKLGKSVAIQIPGDLSVHP